MEAAAKAKIEKAQKRKFDTQCQATQAVLSETIARAAKRTEHAATTPVAANGGRHADGRRDGDASSGSACPAGAG